MLLSETGYFDADSSLKPLLHLWSLGVEEQFYISWPIVLSLTPRRSRMMVILISMFGSFALNVVLIGRHPDAAFYLPFTRIWEFMAGAALLHVSVKNTIAREIVLPLIALVGSCLILGCYNSQTHFPGSAPWGQLQRLARHSSVKAA